MAWIWKTEEWQFDEGYLIGDSSKKVIGFNENQSNDKTLEAQLVPRNDQRGKKWKLVGNDEEWMTIQSLEKGYFLQVPAFIQTGQTEVGREPQPIVRSKHTRNFLTNSKDFSNKYQLHSLSKTGLQGSLELGS